MRDNPQSSVDFDNDSRDLLAYTPIEPNRLLREYCSRGLVVLSPESLGVSGDIHKSIYETEKELFDARKTIDAHSIPEVCAILSSPGVVDACNAILGENWAIVPFTHNAPFPSGARDQHWHKDDNGPFNGRKHRHHQAVQAELLYYPQAVQLDMGPTATVPYSQYWTFNHEENHDNFAGADHLDFAYHLSGMEWIPVSGPKSSYSQQDVVEQRTDHDVRMRSAVEKLEWPLNKPFEVGPLHAGSVVIYSHNLLHRGNHRRDAWKTWKQRPRFMWRFWLFRTTEPCGELPPAYDWRTESNDGLTGVDTRSASEDVTSVWNYHLAWIHSGHRKTNSEVQEATLTNSMGANFKHLEDQLRLKGETNEPKRIGAAYRLAHRAEYPAALDVLHRGLHDDLESVRRAATYGLAAVGSSCTPILLAATASTSRWVRKAAAFCLGEAGELAKPVVDELTTLLLSDPSVYVRSVAASALGCVGRRAVGESEDTAAAVVPVSSGALVQSLSLEPNRLAMDKAQGRSIKLVRPTDECDVCEGIGIDYGEDRYEPVRSAVRENALWSLVVLCSHGPATLGQSLDSVIQCLTKIAISDKNVFCAGFAMDALNRLLHLDCRVSSRPSVLKQLSVELPYILATSTIHPTESLIRGGLPIEQLQAIKEEATLQAKL